VANEWVARVRGFWAERNARERLILSVGSLVLLVLVLYAWVYQPIEQSRAKLAQRLPRLRAELRLMRVQVAEIERLRAHPGESASGTLEQRIKSSAATFGLAEGFTQFTSLDNNRVQLSTQPLPPGTWIDWLSDLGRRGVTVARCRITEGDEPGLAKLELTLTGARQ
jgi:general secretion pathway protein M